MHFILLHYVTVITVKFHHYSISIPDVHNHNMDKSAAVS